ncbi:MAG: cytochrome c oxidase subunit 3 [Chloroflexota bacterium]
MAQQPVSHAVNPGALELGGIEAVRRVDPNALGILVFISSEAIFFASLIITYIVARSGSNGGPTAHVLNVGTTAIFTVCLFASSATMERVTAHLHRNDSAGVRRWLLITIALGAIFLIGQGIEYTTLYRDSVTMGTNLWSSAFFTLTGFHGFHVLIGVTSMAIIASLVGPGPDHPRAGSAVHTISYYWHFVDAVWVVIFPVVYLWTLIS